MKLLSNYEISENSLKFFIFPIRELLECIYLPFEGECELAGEEVRCGSIIPGAIFVVAHQWKSPAGELHTDLMAAPRM